MVFVGGLGTAPLRLDDIDFVIADNNVVAAEDTTIAELIEGILEGAPLPVPPMLLAMTVVLFHSQ